MLKLISSTNFNGIRQRLYSGASLDQPLFPNRAKTASDKQKLLLKFKHELQKALERGWSHQNYKQIINDNNMSTQLTIVNAKNLKARAYVSFYFEGKRQRLSSGVTIGFKISPNRAKTIKERLRLLNELNEALSGLLATNNYPFVPDEGSREIVQPIVLLKSLKKKNWKTEQLDSQLLSELILLHQDLTENLTVEK